MVHLSRGEDTPDLGVVTPVEPRPPGMRGDQPDALEDDDV